MTDMKLPTQKQVMDFVQRSGQEVAAHVKAAANKELPVLGRHIIAAGREMGGQLKARVSQVASIIIPQVTSIAIRYLTNANEAMKEDAQQVSKITPAEIATHAVAAVTIGAAVTGLVGASLQLAFSATLLKGGYNYLADKESGLQADWKNFEAGRAGAHATTMGAMAAVTYFTAAPIFTAIASSAVLYGIYQLAQSGTPTEQEDEQAAPAS